MSDEELRVLLEKGGLAPATWGAPGTGTKTLQDFGREMREGDARIWCENGEVRCFRQGARIELLYKEEATGRLFRLEEVRQEYPDGTKKDRHLPCLRESWKNGETLHETAKRGAEEEAGVLTLLPEDFKIIRLPLLMPPYVSETYPGLVTVRIEATLRAFLNFEQFRAIALGARVTEFGVTTISQWRLCTI